MPRPMLEKAIDSQAGLVVFIVVVGLSVVALLFDDWLIRTGRTSITAWVTDGTFWHAIVGGLLVAAILAGGTGLAFHFITYRE